MHADDGATGGRNDLGAASPACRGSIASARCQKAQEHCGNEEKVVQRAGWAVTLGVAGVVAGLSCHRLLDYFR